MTAKAKVYDLNDKIITELSTIDTSSKLLAGENNDLKAINIDIVKASLNYISAGSKADYNFAMEGILVLSNLYSDTFYSINQDMNDILNVLYSDSRSLSAFAVSNSISSSMSSISSSCNKALGSCTSFANSINPANYSDISSYIKSIAQFLLCPEASLLGDLLGAAKSILNAVTNLRPAELLNAIKSDLASLMRDVVSAAKSYATSALGSVLNTIMSNLPPSANSLLGFIEKVQLYASAFIDLAQELWDAIESIMRMFGLTADDLFGIGILSDLGTSIKNAINNNNSSNNSGIQIVPGIKVPSPVDTIRCSQLAKIMQQQTNSYRANNRYDYLNNNSSIVSGITDSSIKSLFSNYSNYQTNASNANQSTKVYTSMGYLGKTALNSSMAAMVRNASSTRTINSLLNGVNTDADYSAAKSSIGNIANNLITVNNVEMQKQTTMREGLKNIMTESNYYNIPSTKFGV
ncbi:g081 [Yersinia phage phiR1-37]|uniref:hypothetical protein n=1 Tax=Yersinia phage phiR1-37 TaxID=331278 RepID=UPI00022DBCFD|nr:hypothetical protein phiR1-37_gp081 [Yersinia phage phiR1-37]CCE26105.1 g081 [Yersinia phage phiR1-37]